MFTMPVHLLIDCECESDDAEYIDDLPELLEFEDLNLDEISTPIDVAVFVRMLNETSYSETETKFLEQGFREGFSIGYQGTEFRQDTSNNIPFTVGNKFDLWEKIMTEVGKHRVAGPFPEIPFACYIQSPVGLVPKAEDKMRMIFHLSYNFGDREEQKSLNYHTPRHLCTVSYNDLDTAVASCLKVNEKREALAIKTPIMLSKSDLRSAFRVIPIKPEHRKWLIFKAKHPVTDVVYYFADKCLPFGASVSCAHFQRFSNAVHHIVEQTSGREGHIVNYLDDFLFIDVDKVRCDALVSEFLRICEKVQLPVVLEKTEWSEAPLVFLGILLDGVSMSLALPIDKRDKALKMLSYFIDKRKVTVKHLQTLTGYLNFLTKAIHPGRVFTRHMYSKNSEITKDKSGKFKQYYHVSIDKEFRFDCAMWCEFLLQQDNLSVCRPMIDLNRFETSRELFFYTDTSGNPLWVLGEFTIPTGISDNGSLVSLNKTNPALHSWNYMH